MKPTEKTNSEISQQKRVGATMIAAMWLSLMALLAFIFSGILDEQHNPNTNINTLSTADGIKELSLQRNRFGHYVTDGKINNTSVVFMLDTGATDVSIPESVANRIGLSKGRQMTYQTANGKINVYATRLQEISIGEIRLYNIRATINPNVQGDNILLGMSFLKHLEFTQRGNSLTLRQYPEE
ncbi:MAG: TIGR02281 family clan AA aspartic protease [Gammaproteobacteria bacterium]|nr:TIGR02281 family clan AA aspartic protease [Gammaproteobacteria bacterium]